MPHMGVSIYYQALPEQSTLFKRIKTEKKINTLFDALFPYGYGIFYLLDWDKEELNEHLDGIFESNEVFDSRSDVDLCLNELCMELEQAEASYPGLSDQTVYLEKIQHVFEERLLRELKRRQLDNYVDYVQQLLYGSQDLAPELYNENSELFIVPSSVVREGVQMLREIEPERLFENAGDLEKYELERFENWKALYLEAAERGDAVVIRFC